MKKIKISVIALVLMFIGVSVFVACSKEEDDTTVSKESVLSSVNNNTSKTYVGSSTDKLDITNPDNYGAIHNQLLDLYYQEGKPMSEYASKEEFLNDFYRIAVNKYPEMENPEALAEVKSGYFKDFGNPDVTVGLRVGLDDLFKRKKISLVLYTSFKTILYTNSYEESMKIIAVLEKTPLLTDNDKQAIRVFKSIFTASHQYWGITNGKYKYCSEISDALVGFLASETGPFAVLIGAAGSAFVNETGGCNN